MSERWIKEYKTLPDSRLNDTPNTAMSAESEILSQIYELTSELLRWDLRNSAITVGDSKDLAENGLNLWVHCAAQLLFLSIFLPIFFALLLDMIILQLLAFEAMRHFIF